MARREVRYKQGLNEEELRKELSSVAKTANRRLRELEAEKIKTFAYGVAKTYARNQGRKGAPRFRSGVNMDYNAMQKEYAQAVKFMKSETATVSGMREAVSNMEAAFGENFDIEGLNKRQLNRLWKTLSAGHWREIQQAMQTVSSDQIIESVIEGVKKGMTIRELKTTLNSIADDLEDETLDWANFDERFTREYAQTYHF